jgi:hypothetical protein
VVNGLIVRFGSGGAAPGQQVQAAQRTEVANVLESQMREYLGYSSMVWLDSLQGEFKKRLQAFSPK